MGATVCTVRVGSCNLAPAPRTNQCDMDGVVGMVVVVALSLVSVQPHSTQRDRPPFSQYKLIPSNALVGWVGDTVPAATKMGGGGGAAGDRD